MSKISEKELRKIKDRAARAIKKGSWEKALEHYEKLVEVQPKDLRLQMKQAEILVKVKKQDEAFDLYEKVAEAYAKDGFLIQAVSVYKLMMQLDPDRPGLTEKLEELNRARGIPAAKPRPKAVPPDGAPGLPEVEIEIDEGEDETSLKDEIKQAKKEQAKVKRGKDAFPDTPLFGQLGEEEFTQVVSKFQVGTIPRGTLVIKEGTQGDSFFIISHGDVRVFRTHPKTEKKITLAHLKDGQFFGEMAFFLDSVRQASCETAQETVLLRINREDMEELMEEYPNIKEVMHDFFKRRAMDQLFKTMGIFASLEEAERTVVADKFEMVEVEMGETLIEEGEEGAYLYVIYSGELEVTTVHEEKGPLKLATLGPGDFCGEIAIVHGRPNTADVTTSAKSLLFRMPRPVFKELLAIHSPMVDELAEIIDERMKATNRALMMG